MRILLLLAVIFTFHFTSAQTGKLGVFTHSEDIGHPKKAGSSAYDATAKIYLLKGSGYNIWFNRDEFRYLYKKLSGDFRLTADFQFMGDTGNAHRKIGWMLRESNDEAAVSINAVLHGDGLVVMQWRGEKGMNMRDPQDEIFFPGKKIYKVIQLERKGKTITMRIGNPGEALQLVGSHDMPLPDTVLAGLFICSHDENNIEQAIVTNVKIDKP
jgi:hypothetical protein